MKKRILFVIPALNIGGAEKSIIELLKVFDYQKYSVDLLLLQNRGKLVANINDNVNIIDGDEIISTLLNSLKKSVFMLMNKKRLLLALKRILLTIMFKFTKDLNSGRLFWKMFKNDINMFDGEYDVAVSYLQGVSEYYTIDKIKAKSKVLWMHTSFKHYSNMNEMEIRYISMFNKIVCVSEDAKNDFIQLFPEKAATVKVFYNLIDKAEIIKMAVEKPEIEFNSNFFNIVSVGRLHEAKGYDISIMAFYELCKTNQNIRFYIIGEGPEKDRLSKMISEMRLSEKCILVGATLNPYTYLSRADLVLQASRYEGYCIVLAEAKALGKPIVTTDFFGAKEQIEDGKNGIIVKCNKNSIIDGLKKIINNDDLRKSISFELSRTQNNEGEIMEAIDDILS